MEFAFFFFFVFAFPSSIPIILDPMVYRLFLVDSFMLLLLEEDLTYESAMLWYLQIGYLVWFD